jgi:membrane-associated phospholipid phosphatase
MSRRTLRSRQILFILGFSTLQTVGGSMRCLTAQESVRSVDVAVDSAAWATALRSEPAAVMAAWVAGGAAFAALLLADEPSREVAQDWRGEGSEEVARIGRWYGSWRSSAPYLLGGTLLIGVATRGTQGIVDAAAVFAGTFAGSMSSEVLNQAVGRRRPNEGHGRMSFDPFSGHASFPSGHTAFAFSFAGSIDAVTTGWFPAALAYGAASLTGLSRMHDDKHWLSDVVAGALIGTFVSRATAANVRSLLSRGRGGTKGEPAFAYSSTSDVDTDSNVGAASAPQIRMVAGSAYVGLELRF